MTESKKLCIEPEELEKKKLDLQKQKEESLIAEGKAYNCKKCDKVVVKNDAPPAQLETDLCWDCLQKLRRKEYEEKILTKIGHGRIVNIELDTCGWFQNIKRITVHHQGMMYELRTVCDEGESYIIIDKEWKEEESLESFEEDIKPWQKTRKEKPLPTFINEQ